MSFCEEYLKIRYKNFRFELRIEKGGAIVQNKASMLRGMLGDYLLEKYCAHNCTCEKCNNRDNCQVQKIMYADLKINEPSVTENGSFGYIISCNDFRKTLLKADTLNFELTLFGDNVFLFGDYFNAFTDMGKYGIGSSKVEYSIATITDENGTILYDETKKIQKSDCSYVMDYVRDKEKVSSQWDGRIDFVSPLALKFHGKMLNDFNIDAIISAIKRRIYLLNCYEGNEIEMFYGNDETGIKTIYDNNKLISIPRYSNRKHTKMFFKGLIGEMKIDIADMTDKERNALLELFLAAEILHIGKNTSFGFGKMEVK